MLGPIGFSWRRAAPLAPGDLTEYRGAIGKLLWLASQTRPDLALRRSMDAQRSFCLVFRRRPRDIFDREIYAFADSAFANAEGHKSQYGMIGGVV